MRSKFSKYVVNSRIRSHIDSTCVFFITGQSDVCRCASILQELANLGIVLEDLFWA